MTLILCVVKRSATYNAKAVYRLVIARTYAAPRRNWRNELTSNITLRIDDSQRVYLTDNCISYGVASRRHPRVLTRGRLSSCSLYSAPDTSRLPRWIPLRTDLRVVCR